MAFGATGSVTVVALTWRYDVCRITSDDALSFAAPAGCRPQATPSLHHLRGIVALSRVTNAFMRFHVHVPPHYELLLRQTSSCAAKGSALCGFTSNESCLSATPGAIHRALFKAGCASLPLNSDLTCSCPAFQIHFASLLARSSMFTPPR